MGTSASASTVTIANTKQPPLGQHSESTISMDKNNKQSDPDRSSLWHLLEFDMQSLENSRWWRAGAAGSIAGLTEHTILYPIDTVKTRMQAVLISNIGTQYKSFLDCFTQV